MASISRKETIAALEPLKAALVARSAIMELGHIWFDGQAAYATNGGLGVKVKFASPLKCGVPGGLFLGLLNQAAADTLDFDFKDDVLKFKFGRSSMKLNTLPFERMIWRYPEKPTEKPAASLKVTEAFTKGLKRVLALKPRDPKRMEHHAVCIFAVDKEMDLFTTDSSSLLVMPVSEPLSGSKEEIALPRELAEQIVSRCKSGCTLQMFSDHFYVPASDAVSLYSNVFDTSDILDLPTFSDRFTDDKVAPPFKIPEGFDTALERVALLAGSEEPTLTLSAAGKVLRLKGKFKFGAIDEEFTLEKAALKATISLDAKTLMSASGVNELAFAEGFANLRSEDGFMYIMAPKSAPDASGAEASPGTEPAEDEEAGEEVAAPAKGKFKAVRNKGASKGTPVNARGKEMDDDIPF